MGKINYGRVILGGIVGGIVGAIIDDFCNGMAFQLWMDTVKSLNRPNAFIGAPVTATVGLFVLFIVGAILMVWLYAAVRPRLGAGVRTAIYIGFIVWAFVKLIPNTFWVLAGIFGRRIMFYDTLFGIFEFLAAAVIGAWLYKEAESAAAYPAASETHQTATR